MKSILFALLLAGPWTVTLAAGPMGTVSDLHGSATLLDPVTGSAPLRAGQSVFEGQTLTTREDGEVHIATIDGAVIALRPNSSLRIDAYRANRTADDRIHLALVKGALRSITGWVARMRQDSYQLRTATATIGVRGTDHETIEFDGSAGTHAAGVYERVFQGATVVRRENEEIEVREGQIGFVARDRRDRPRLLNELPPALKNRQFRLEARLAARRETSGDPMPSPLSDRQVERLREAPGEKLPEGRERQPNAPGEAAPPEARERVAPPAESMAEPRERLPGALGDTTPEQREHLRKQFDDATPEQRERLRNQLDSVSPEPRDRPPRPIIRRLRPNS